MTPDAAIAEDAVVLDSTAVLVLLADRPGADKVEEVIAGDRAVMSAMAATDLLPVLDEYKPAAVDQLKVILDQFKVIPFGRADLAVVASLPFPDLGVTTLATVGLGVRLRRPVLTTRQSLADLKHPHLSVITI